MRSPTSGVDQWVLAVEGKVEGENGMNAWYNNDIPCCWINIKCGYAPNRIHLAEVCPC